MQKHTISYIFWKRGTRVSLFGQINCCEWSLAIKSAFQRCPCWVFLFIGQESLITGLFSVQTLGECWEQQG